MPHMLKGQLFTEIVTGLIPEIKMVKLAKLEIIILKKGRRDIYEPLADSLRKIQWVKFVGLRAKTIEDDIRKHWPSDAVLMHPLGQIDHAISVTDCIIHTKSSLDSMAVFLTSFYNLDAKGGERDLKKEVFRKKIIKKDPILGQIIKKQQPWFNYLQDIRDELIHRSSKRAFLVSDPSQVGVLPIIRKASLIGKLPPSKMHTRATRKYFWSTEEFITHQYNNLLTLFKVISDRCIEIEENDLDKPLSVSDLEYAHKRAKLCLFPLIITGTRTVNKFILGPINIPAYFARLRVLK